MILDSNVQQSVFSNIPPSLSRHIDNYWSCYFMLPHPFSSCVTKEGKGGRGSERLSRRGRGGLGSAEIAMDYPSRARYWELGFGRRIQGSGGEDRIQGLASSSNLIPPGRRERTMGNGMREFAKLKKGVAAEGFFNPVWFSLQRFVLLAVRSMRIWVPLRLAESNGRYFPTSAMLGRSVTQLNNE